MIQCNISCYLVAWMWSSALCVELWVPLRSQSWMKCGRPACENIRCYCLRSEAPLCAEARYYIMLCILMPTCICARNVVCLEYILWVVVWHCMLLPAMVACRAISCDICVKYLRQQVGWTARVAYCMSLCVVIHLWPLACDVWCVWNKMWTHSLIFVLQYAMLPYGVILWGILYELFVLMPYSAL